MNEHIFDNITTPNQAYWLGFLAGDGCVRKNRLLLALSSKDKEHLFKFKKFLNAPVDIKERQTLCSNNGKRYPTSYITIYSHTLISGLAQYNIIPNKTQLNVDFSKNIPLKFKIYFVFGLFDADGWFTNTEKSQNFGIGGNYSVISSALTEIARVLNWDDMPNIHRQTKVYSMFSSSMMRRLLDFTTLYISAAEKCDLLLRKYNIAILINQHLTNYYKNEQLKTEKIYNCLNCGKPISRNSITKLCQFCWKITQRVVERPSRDVLKDEIRHNSFLSLGRKYNVSDNAIRKWCKYYNLPCKVTEIKQYTDTEWSVL